MPRWRVVLAGVMTAVALAGCTPAPEPPPTVPTVAANAPTDLNARPRDGLTDDGVLRMRIAAIPVQWNPLTSAGNTADVTTLTGPLRTPAFNLDAAGRPTPNPALVTDVRVSHVGSTEVRLTLNPDARWGDGAPLTAADWVATWRAFTGQIRGVTPVSSPGWDAVGEVAQGANEREVIVRYTRVVPDWAEPLAGGPQRAETLTDAAAFDWPGFDAGHYAGPFTVTHVDAVQGVITLAPNPQWWGDEPALRTIAIRVLPDEAAPAAFRHNELDVLDVGLNPATLERIRGDATTGVRAAPAPAGRVLQVADAGLLADPALRRILVRSIDRTAIGAALASHDIAPTTVWSDPLLLPSQPGYLDQGRATGLTYDRERAVHELTQAGWASDAEGARGRNGQVLILTFELDPTDPLAAVEFESIRASLTDVGISLVSVPVGAGADMTPTTVAVSPFPLAHLPVTVQGDLADYAERIGTATDPVRRADQANQLSRLLWAEVNLLPLYQLPDLVGVRSGLANLGAGGYTSVAWESVGWQR